MRCVDVNVLVYAHREDAPDHVAYRDWLEAQRVGQGQLGVPGVVLSGFLRIVTHPRIFREPTPLSTAIEFTDALMASPSVLAVEPAGRHRSIFLDLVRVTRSTGNRIPDAYIAAIAIEHGFDLFSADRGMARFPGLRWKEPLEEAREAEVDGNGQ